MKNVAKTCFLIAVLAISCSPAAPTRIGPGIPPRQPDCEIEILKKGEKPTRPYRDIGMVALENCPDYNTAPCREWLRKAVCELGGEIVYEFEKNRPDSQILDPVTYRVMAAVYVADFPYNLETDPVYKALTCNPPCGEKERCRDGKCVSLPEADCAEAAKKADAQSQDPERCLE